jgi:hypothetical protein
MAGSRFRSTELVCYDQMWHPHHRLDGCDSLFFAWQLQREQGCGGAMAGARESLNLRYMVPNMTWFLPMRSRRWEEPVLHTYDCGNRWWKAGDGATVWSTLGDGKWLLWWSSGDRKRLNKILVFPSCSSMLQFPRAAMNWTHTARNPWWLGFSFVRQNS